MTSSALERDYYGFEPVETSSLEYATPGASSLLLLPALPTLVGALMPSLIVDEQSHSPHLRNSPGPRGHGKGHEGREKSEKPEKTG